MNDTSIKTKQEIESIYLGKGNKFLQYPLMKKAIEKAAKNQDVSNEVENDDFLDKRKVTKGCLGAISEFFSKIGDLFRSIIHNIKMCLDKTYSAKFREKATHIAQLCIAYNESLIEADKEMAEEADECQEEVDGQAEEGASKEKMTRTAEQVQNVVQQPDQNALKIQELKEAVAKLEQEKVIIDGQKATALQALADLAIKKEANQKALKEVKDLFLEKNKERDEYIDKIVSYDESDALMYLASVIDEHKQLKNQLDTMMAQQKTFFGAVAGAITGNKKILEKQLLEKAKDAQEATEALEAMRQELKSWEKMKKSLGEELGVAASDEDELIKKLAEGEQAEKEFQAKLSLLNQQTDGLDKSIGAQKEEMAKLGAEPVQAPLSKAPPVLTSLLPETVQSIPVYTPVASPMKPKKVTTYDRIMNTLNSETAAPIANLLSIPLKKFGTRLESWEQVDNEPGTYKLALKFPCYMETFNTPALMTFQKHITMKITPHSVAITGVKSYANTRVSLLGWQDTIVTQISVVGDTFKMSGKVDVPLKGETAGSKDVPIVEATANWQSGKAVTLQQAKAFKAKNC